LSIKKPILSKHEGQRSNYFTTISVQPSSNKHQHFHQYHLRRRSFCTQHSGIIIKMNSSSSSSFRGGGGNDGTDYSSYTYEAKRALEWNASQADNVHWERDAAYRNQNYRQLHHQDGLVGTFSIRLLEAADLKRSYWSALALGPMKLLGLSKAHGSVSSYVSFGFDVTGGPEYYCDSATVGGGDYFTGGGGDRKMPAKQYHQQQQHQQKQRGPLHQIPTFVSPVAPQDNNPVWTNCSFHMSLRKGAFHDGHPIRLFLRVDEDATALENILPGIPSSGGDARLLGVGYVDLSSLCLGQVPLTGRADTGVIDAWVPIRLPDEDPPMLGGSLAEQTLLLQEVAAGKHNKKGSDNSGDTDLKQASKVAAQSDKNKVMGRVRILVTYRPHGMEPQHNDFVALEAFARQNLQIATSPAILPPLHPLHVLEVSGPWLLVEYRLPYQLHGSTATDGSVEDSSRNKACMRIHRNAVFVIERKNFLDATLNVALQPADFVLSTPLGQGAKEILGPLFVAGKQLMMPALLSSKLVWMAVRATALASLTGVAAASSAFVQEGTHSLTRDGGGRRGRPHRKSVDENGNGTHVSL
jgi:hypothetical protein